MQAPVDSLDQRNDSQYTVAVRTLCEFTARSGDLAVRFTPAPSAQQGIAGHGVVAARRGADYQREVRLRGIYRELSVRGRADGYDRALNRLEEFKTHRGDLARMPQNQRGLHWAQLKLYGALMCRERALADISLALVYFDIKTEQESVLEEHWIAADLQGYFEEHCEHFLGWARQELAHRRARDPFLTGLDFPHQTLRTRQRDMSAAVYRSVCAAKTLVVQAPTGIGKTLGTLYPMLKAAPRQRLDRVFYLVAKTSGRKLALDALRALTTSGDERDHKPLRVLELTAKAAACEMPGRACDGASCPLARGFYDRLAQARSAAIEHTILDRETLSRVARASQICPYFLSLEMARWCDVVVGDYSYYFDSSALLQGLAAQNEWRIGLLVDEAHNLVTRARDMYSALLDPAVMEAAHTEAPAALRAPLEHLRRGWSALRGAAAQYTVHDGIPRALIVQLERAITAIADHLAADPAGIGEDVLRFYFDAIHFCRMAEAFGSHSLFDVSGAAEGALCIRNVNPAPFLAPRFGAATTAILFSATLSPAAFYVRLLGLSKNAAWLNVESPFDAAQLTVRVERRISTRFRDRGRSARPIVELMARQYRTQPGNYLAFFSSFDYLRAVLAEFVRHSPEVPIHEQTQGMRAEERDAFLANFTQTDSGIGFAVLGGVFAEGIDLPGERLIGAFIATLGMPQVNPVNAQIERRLHDLFGQGYEYTYLYPGLQRVVQAAGRVIRTPSDRGCVYLMDDRFAGAQVRGLLPAWWRVECS